MITHTTDLERAQAAEIERLTKAQRLTDEQRERKKAYMRDWYAKNRERQIANVGEWQRSNREKANATKRAYVERNPEKRREQSRRHGAKPEARAKAYANPARKAWHKARAALDVAELGDGFVRRVMAQRMAIKGSELPQALVDAYRELMKIKRLINEKRG